MNQPPIPMAAPGGTGYLIPWPEKDAYLRKGFKVIEPEIKSAEPASLSVAASTITVNDGRVAVNSCTLKELVDLPQLGTATAKAVVKTRPHQDIASLIEKVPAIDWVSLADRLLFEE